MQEITYKIAPNGFATGFTEPEVPIEYSLKFRNRFINPAGGAEKRPGMAQLGTTIAGQPVITAIHEHISPSGVATLFVSGGGSLYSYNGTSYTAVRTGIDTTNVLQSVQMGNRLIFTNGVDRIFWTDDGTTFESLVPIVEQGEATGGTIATQLEDSDVGNWIGGTNVATNDLVYNRTKDAYGIITAVATATLVHTAIGSAATGIGITMVGNQNSGDRYEVHDLIELNIIPTTGEDDNVAVLTSGASVTRIAVSGVNFATTDARVGDYVHNTTRSAVTRVTSVSANLVVVTVASQVAGDSVVFLKSATPIATRLHVHYDRLYAIDQRDQRQVRVSGPLDPTNWTTDTGTLDSGTLNTGSFQPQGDIILAMSSFQRFLALFGRQNTYYFEGTDPIASTAAATISFSPIGLFPQGLVAANGAQSIGNDILFLTPDGVQAIGLVDDASELNRSNVSQQINATLRADITNTTEALIQAFHYRRRSWFMVKVGSQIYCYNYSAYLGDQTSRQRLQTLNRGSTVHGSGSWTLFDGKFAQQRAYFIRQDGTLVCAGSGGKVYTFDPTTAVYGDDGDEIATEYQTGWLTLDEPRKSVNVKSGVFIKPIFQAGDTITYTILAEGGYDASSTDTISVQASGAANQPIGLAEIGINVIGGSSIQNLKYPLRWRGDVVRVTISTSDIKGPDILSRFSLYANKHGKR